MWYQQHELSLCGGCFGECQDHEDVKKASLQATQPADFQVCLCSGWVEGIWPDSLGSLVSCPRATFLCLRKLSIVFRPVGLSMSYMRGVVYAPRSWGFTKVCVCHGFISPPFKITAGSKRVKNSNLHELFNTSPNSTKLTFIALLKQRHGIWLQIVWTAECQYK